MRVGVDRIRHRIGRHSCSKLASRLLPGSRYRSSPVRLMLIPTHGVLPTVPRAGLTVGSSPSNNAAQRSAETAVSASQTSSTPDLKLRPPAANESTNRANARLQECVALPEGARCPLLAQSGHPLLHCSCPLLGVKRTYACALQMSAYDPKRTSALIGTRRPLQCRRGVRVSRPDAAYWH